MAEVQEISRAEFARIAAVSRAAVTKAVTSGRFTAEALGEGTNLRMPAALEQWRANKGGDFDQDEDEDDESDTRPVEKLPAGSVADEKRLSYKARREKIELENAVTRGELISRDAVIAALADAGEKIAADLDSIVAWSEELAALDRGDVSAVRTVLKTRIRKLREQLADRFAKVMSGETQADDDE